MSGIRPYLWSLCTLACLGMAAVSADPLYKWVDDQGHVHYTQTPPPSAGTQAKPMHLEVARADATAAAAYAASVQKAKDDQARKDKEAADAAADVDKEAAIREKMDADQAPEQQKEVQLQYCKGLQSQLNTVEHEDDSLTPMQRGERKYTDDVAHQKRVDAIKAQIASQC